MYRKLIITALVAIASQANSVAQDDVEYRWEIGAGAGLMTYTGDFNGALLSGGNTAPALTAILRRTFNPYSHLRMAVTYGKVKGESKDTQTYYPDFNTHIYEEHARGNYTFSNTVLDIGAVYEYNFWPYGTGRDYRGAQRLTPFVAIGFGFTYANCGGGWFDAAGESGTITQPDGSQTIGAPEMKPGSAFTANIPVGVGVKYKMGDRTNVQLSWLCHFTLSDKLDGAKDPYRIQSSGIFKNTDCYSVLQASLTYSFGPKCKTCMNQDW